jgi:beta-glucanase (GH16 family)
MVMTTHWRIHATGIVQSCGFEFLVPDASSDFHDYGVLWAQDRAASFVWRARDANNYYVTRANAP